MYSLLFTLAFLLLLPLFILKREKYASGFRERFGRYSRFDHNERPVVWLHCVSVGEVNAVRPLAAALKQRLSGHRIVVSTVTKTGQTLARQVFADTADRVFYFPFDWKFTVRRALRHFRPSVVILAETELWPNFISTASSAGVKLAIVNGRLSDRSTRRYQMVRRLIARVLAKIDLALMQSGSDAERIISLGMAAERVSVTGNLKFDLTADAAETKIAAALKQRFGFDGGRPVIIAASTHSPEEQIVIAAFAELTANADARPRLLIAPRHPERFDKVFDLVPTELKAVRRSSPESDGDRTADVILLDSIGELRAVYRAAAGAVVFVGGSLIPHGGQSVLEPAAAGSAMITGPHTSNFRDVVAAFKKHEALITLNADGFDAVHELAAAFATVLDEKTGVRDELARNAAAVMEENRGASELSADLLTELIKR